MSGGGCSKLSCEIRIIGAENVEIGGKKKPKGGGSGSVFVRMYISSGNGRVQLNTRDVPVSSSANGSRFGFRWDQSFSLECNGTDESVSQLRGGSVALELRWRPTSTSTSFAVWGPSSKLVGRAELPWGPAFSSPGSLIEAWVPLVGASGDGRGSGLVSKFDSAAMGLVVAMTVSEVVESGRRLRRSGCEEEMCGCCRDGRGINACDDYELFALAAALEEF